MPVGYSFSPTFQNAEMGKRGGQPPTVPQSSLQTLNYSLPSTGPRALSPQQGQGQMGSSISSAVLQSVFRTILGPDYEEPSATDTGMGDRGGFAPSYDPGTDVFSGYDNGRTVGSPGVNIIPGDTGRMPDAGRFPAESLNPTEPVQQEQPWTAPDWLDPNATMPNFRSY